MSQEKQELTFGQKAVGINFNPGGNSSVNEIKQKYADCIDFLNDFRNDSNKSVSSEAKRQASIAITELQTSQMWAVKAITWTE